MSVALKIELSPQAEKIVTGFQTLPGRVVAAIAAGMDEANQYAIGKITRDHLTGQGPFPPSEHKLGVRTNRLRSSVWASGAQQTGGTQIQSAIGSNVIYAGIHEFGGTIHHPARQMKLRHRIDSRGALMKQPVNGRLLVFARNDHKRAREMTVEAKAHDVTMPERAPFRTGIQESRKIYTQTVSRRIVVEWNKMGGNS